MGIRGVWTTFRRQFTAIEPLECPPYKIGIDMFSLVYTHRANLDELLELLLSWAAHGHTITCVWDGNAPKEKKEIIGQRRTVRESATEKKNDLETYLTDYKEQLSEADIQQINSAITSLSWQGWHMTGSIKRKIQDTLGPSITHTFAPGEADDILIDMTTSKTIDIVMSLDSDLFAMGAERIWRLLRVKGKWHLEDISVEAVCMSWKITLAQLQDACFLAGWDRCHLSTGGTHMQFDMALNRIKHYKTYQNVLHRFPPAEPLEEGAIQRLLVLKKESKARWQHIIRDRISSVAERSIPAS